MSAAEWFKRVPWTIPLCAAGLMVAGLIGIACGDESAGSGDFAPRQVVWIALSIPAMIGVTLVPYRSLRGWSYALFALCLVLLAAVYFLPPRNGSRRWIPLGLLYFQPSELAKLTFVLALAHYLTCRRNYRRLRGLLVPFVLTLVPVGLVLREPDLGTSLLFFPALFAMLFAAGARPRNLSLVGALGMATLPALWLGMTGEQQSRIVALFTQRDGGPAPTGDGYHLHQSKQVLALGGWCGAIADRELGSRKSEVRGRRSEVGTATPPLTTRHSPAPQSAIRNPQSAIPHLPAARTDFVFCLVGERFGLLGTLMVLLLYVVLFGRGLLVAAGTREPFGRLLAVGVVALLAAQTVINTGMTVGLMPITGMTLPLMSYGGSSLLATCISLGLLMNVGMRPGYEVGPDPLRFATER